LSEEFQVFGRIGIAEERAEALLNRLSGGSIDIERISSEKQFQDILMGFR
jgi:hypothetical protein